MDVRIVYFPAPGPGAALPTNLVPLSSREDISTGLFTLPDANTSRSTPGDAGPADVGGSTADRYWHTTTSSAGLRLAFGVANDTYNISGYFLKGGTNFLVRMIPEGNNVWFDLSNVETNNGTNAVITDAGGGWYRCSSDVVVADSNLRVDFLSQSARWSTTEMIGDGTTNYVGIVGIQLTAGSGVKAYNGVS